MIYIYTIYIIYILYILYIIYIYIYIYIHTRIHNIFLWRPMIISHYHAADVFGDLKYICYDTLGDHALDF